MKGIILAGGHGTRLYPLTKITSKHLLPVGRFPMIYYAVKTFRDAGITEILLVTAQKTAGAYIELFGSGKEWGVRLMYSVQDDAGGIAQALAQAEPFIASGEKLAVLLGDNLFEEPILPYVQQFDRQSGGAKVILKEVADPRSYGVPVFENDRIVFIEEKPAQPKNNYCVTGLYMYDSEVFDVIRGIRPSARGELEITDVNNTYAAKGDLSYNLISGWWTDAGTFESLHEASGRYLRGGSS